MTLLELKARFGELAILEKQNQEQLRRIVSEQQEVFNKIVEAEKTQTLPTPNTDSPKEVEDDIVHTN